MSERKAGLQFCDANSRSPRQSLGREGQGLRFHHRVLRYRSARAGRVLGGFYATDQSDAEGHYGWFVVELLCLGVFVFATCAGGWLCDLSVPLCLWCARPSLVNLAG